jgi:molecular chaperone GrpE
MSKEPHQEAAEQTGTAAEELQVLEQAEDGAESGDGSVNSEQDFLLEQALEKLAGAELAAGKAHDDLLRVQAEMQNLRRRTEQDIEKAHKYGQEKFSVELLGVMDNLERALDAASGHETEAVKAIYDGVNLTLKSFSDCFGKFNIEAVDPLGEPFDPALHQAMSMQENPDVEPNTIITVMQKGYTLHGRVIRPAMVMVAKGSGPKIDESV